MFFLFVSVCIYYSLILFLTVFFFFKQKTAYEMRISDWSSDVCSSDLIPMSYNANNTKFLSEVNLAFRDLGSQFFPAAAQRTRYPIYIHIERGDRKSVV